MSAPRRLVRNAGDYGEPVEAEGGAVEVLPGQLDIVAAAAAAEAEALERMPVEAAELAAGQDGAAAVVVAPATEGPLSLAALDALLAEAEDRSHAVETKSTYRKSTRSWVAFCQRHGLTPFPAAARDLGRWAADQAARGLSPNTIKTRASAIRSVHRRPDLAGLPDPAAPWPVPELGEVDKVVRRHARDLSDNGWKPDKAEALLLADLRRIKRHMAPEGVFRKGIELRDWAILMLGFAMGGRRSELSCLDIEDIALDPDDPQWMAVRICSSKTDQSGAGQVVMIKRAADSELCPVLAVFNLLTWYRMYKDSKGNPAPIVSGPLFRQMAGFGTHLTVHGESVSADALAGRMSGKAISQRYSKRSLDAQIPGYNGRLKRHKGHSGRRGGATEAARAGATHEKMCQHFRWVPGSQMAARYVEESDRRENNPMAAVL